MTSVNSYLKHVCIVLKTYSHVKGKHAYWLKFLIDDYLVFIIGLQMFLKAIISETKLPNKSRFWLISLNE